METFPTNKCKPKQILEVCKAKLRGCKDLLNLLMRKKAMRTMDEIMKSLLNLIDQLIVNNIQSYLGKTKQLFETFKNFWIVVLFYLILIWRIYSHKTIPC